MGTLQDRELMNIDDVIQRQTNAYYQSRNIQNNQIPQTNTNPNNTSSQDVIDLTQDDETNNFDTILDDTLLNMQIKTHQKTLIQTSNHTKFIHIS